ncbi:asparagine synthase-related protein [Halomarina pelagica]|uniref:asparagine synthase-related protein n=1 Tax=Halomarina pelagica TaxID=2961599 RepID=UPI0020C3A87A|nr:asparagine synthase-related protein [Halomarina sp. BND7]
MPGLCGALGSTGCEIDHLRDGLQRSDRELAFDYDEGDVRVSVARHATAASDQPARAPGDAFVWLWGEVQGHDGPNGYVPATRHERERPAAYCADLYDRFGTSFLDGANGTFAGVVSDPGRGVVHLFSDRMGSHPLYYAHAGDGIAFSSHVQSLAVAVDAAFDEETLPEYFTTGRVSGTRTPFVGIEEVPPSSVLTVDLATWDVTTERYWTPRYRPEDRPFSAFVDEFVETFGTVMDEYLDDDRRYGLLLSGGSDSRLLLAGAADRDAVAYHLSDWLSDEASVAERAARAAGCPFVWLKRERDHHRRCLDENPPMMPFYGRFDQAHTAGFDDRLAREVDVVLTGLYADVLFKATTLPQPAVDLGPLGSFTLPIEESIDSVEAYVERYAEPLPPFLDVSTTMEEAFEANVRETDRGIEHHGVVYPSLRELVSLREFYPMSNDPDLFYFGLTQSVPHWTPFLDNRLIDLALRFPIRYQLRRDIVNEAIERLSPPLAAVPHASTGVSLDRSFAAQYVGKYLTSMRRRRRKNEPDVPYYCHRPWVHGPELLRHDRFAIETVLERRDLIEALPFLDWEGVLECYRRHVNGENFYWELFMLVGFLRMPGVERLAGSERRNDGVDGIGGTDGTGGRDGVDGADGAGGEAAASGVDVDITFEDLA